MDHIGSNLLLSVTLGFAPLMSSLKPKFPRLDSLDSASIPLCRQRFSDQWEIVQILHYKSYGASLIDLIGHVLLGTPGLRVSPSGADLFRIPLIMKYTPMVIKVISCCSTDVGNRTIGSH